mmetsp:Transcript_9927/g.25106  ORF Transcript_9927/g.25106 Transcript_9927/m.25106 type:complete len:284 (-) Transcript_9927:164-1015(-)
MTSSKSPLPSPSSPEPWFSPRHSRSAELSVRSSFDSPSSPALLSLPRASAGIPNVVKDALRRGVRGVTGAAPAPFPCARSSCRSVRMASSCESLTCCSRVKSSARASASLASAVARSARRVSRSRLRSSCLIAIWARRSSISTAASRSRAATVAGPSGARCTRASSNFPSAPSWPEEDRGSPSPPVASPDDELGELAFGLADRASATSCWARANRSPSRSSSSRCTCSRESRSRSVSSLYRFNSDRSWALFFCSSCNSCCNCSIWLRLPDDSVLSLPRSAKRR